MRLSLILAAFYIASAQSKIEPAVLGYVYDSGTRSIRAVRGIPGAALLDDEPFGLGFDAAFAAVAPRGAYALAAADDGLRLVRWDRGALTAAPIAGALPAGRFVFSPSGAAAVVCNSAGDAAQRIIGLPDNPAVQDLDAALCSAPVAIADSGTVATAAADCVQIVGSDLAAYTLPIPGAAVLTFDDAGALLLAATPNAIFLAGRPDRGLDLRRFDGRAAEVAPTAAQFAPGASTAIVAYADGVIESIDINSGWRGAFDCQCSPTTVQPFRNGLYRLTELARAPIMLFETTTATPRIWFVPTGRAQ